MVRGICAIRPGVPGLSENIRVRSASWAGSSSTPGSSAFADGGEPVVYIGSADMMHRNLDRRVEALVRIKDPAHIAELDELLELSMDPGTASWHLGPDGVWTRSSVGTDGEPLRDLQAYLIATARAAVRPAVAERRRIPDVTVEQAAGVLCWRRASSDADGLEVLLVHRPRYDDWSWPKGKVKARESLPRTAVREAAEETGLDVVLGRPLGDIEYRLPDGRDKNVVYWAATAVGPAAADPAGDRGRPRRGRRAPAPAVGEEVDELAWLPLEEAAARLTREADVGPLRALERFAAAGELATAPVLVVRHGTSRPRDSWARADADRPLLPAGRRQARGLVPLLASWRPERLVSSPWKRCVDTVEPYATAAGLAVRTKGSLSEDGARRSPGRTRRNVQRLLERARPALLCTHRPVLAEVLGVVRAASTPSSASQLPDSNPFLAPGEVLVAHVALGTEPARVVAVERHQPQS